MESVTSFIRKIFFGLKALINELSESNKSFNGVLERINKAPGLPVANPTTSFWQLDPLFPELVDVRSEKLPGSADIVIIGSGITGASAARVILEQCSLMGIKKTVVMLEARQICSGATGRNGGHIKESPYEGFHRFVKRFGLKRGKAILDFQMRHLPLLLDFARKEGIEAGEVREVETVDLFVDAEAWQHGKKMAQEFSDALPELGKQVYVWEGDVAREKFNTSSHILGAISYPAGALWPYRFVTAVLSTLLSNHGSVFTLETNTAAQSISIVEDARQPYKVHTLRGVIRASHIIHATNGYSANLVPGCTGKLFPVRGQMTVQRPGQSFPDHNGLRSWSLIKNKGFDYITQRPGLPDSVGGLGGELMLGGALFNSAEKGLDEIGVADDADINYTIGSFLGGVLPMTFGEYGWAKDAVEGRMKNSWTGIMGFTADLLPFVGRLDSEMTGRKLPTKTKLNPSFDRSGVTEPGEWISAGYNGDGMVYAWLCGAAVGLMVVGRDNEDLDGDPGIPKGKVSAWLPSELLLTKKRLDKASMYEMATLS